MSEQSNIGRRIKELRLLRGYTREELAEMVDVTARFVYDIELGNKGMSLATLTSLSKALNAPTDYILFGNESTCSPLNPELSILLESCPKDKLNHLNELVRAFLEALNNNESED